MILVRDEPIASIIAEGLEGYASGRFNSQAEVKRFLESHSAFPLCRHGFLTNEQVNRILTYPLYAGYASASATLVSISTASTDAASRASRSDFRAAKCACANNDRPFSVNSVR